MYEANEIAKRLNLDDRVNTTAKREAFITLKDHKPNFANNPTCRLINPAKSEIGKISKQILDRINTTITNHLSLLDQTPEETERIKKEICKIFAKNELKITIEANKKVASFLDVTFDLNTGKFKPYSQPTNTPLYVHNKSNHPPSIIKKIPESVNRRLSEISSDEEVFNEAATPYQEALRKSGYTYNLEFRLQKQTPPSHKRNRSRNIICYNPPFSKTLRAT